MPIEYGYYLNLTRKTVNNMWSNCCGAEASYLSDEICGDCLEHAVFDDEDEDMGDTCRNGKEWNKCECC